MAYGNVLNNLNQPRLSFEWFFTQVVRPICNLQFLVFYIETTILWETISFNIYMIISFLSDRARIELFRGFEFSPLGKI